MEATGSGNGLRLRRKKEDGGSSGRGLGLRDGQRSKMSDPAKGAAGIGRRAATVGVQRSGTDGQENRDQAQQNEKIPQNLRAFEMALAEQVHRSVFPGLSGGAYWESNFS